MKTRIKNSQLRLANFEPKFRMEAGTGGYRKGARVCEDQEQRVGGGKF